eukprot:CAMPEP_0173454026 /NCGR_PEP_ID=MMETSP1357-20121228/51638_1 /TAXON_ID=77926 /ORGANISM="Hemiselmis rufescens, Strain PCC563" /LENGTH=77 /DNA_ID=CAMNT_0014421033 /DNA_START=70 /DNA_END=299 /DNA_ORIENTATION=+
MAATACLVLLLVGGSRMGTHHYHLMREQRGIPVIVSVAKARNMTGANKAGNNKTGSAAAAASPPRASGTPPPPPPPP